MNTITTTRLPGIQSYWLMLIATVVTVSIVTSSQLITQRISLLLDRQASELLAADLVLVSSQPYNARYEARAREFGLQVARTVNFRTAIFIDDSPQLIELKAVDDAYPLRGQLEKTADVTGVKSGTSRGPGAGEVWLDPKLTPLLGETLVLGRLRLAATWLISYEPDRGGTLFSVAPRIMMNLADLPGTGLIMPGSRARYRLLFAGQQQQITEFKDWITPRLGEAEKIQDLKNARPEMRQALERTQKFFAFSIVLTLVIAMVAIAITARYTASREASKVAMLRAFGISQARLLIFYSRQLGKIWFFATLIGIGIGWFSQYPLQWALDGWFARELPQVYMIRPYLSAALVGFISLAGFSLPYLANVTTTPPMQVFRPVDTRKSLRRSLLVISSAIVTVFLVLLILVQNSKLAMVTLVMILLAALLLPVIFRFMINALLFSSPRHFWLRQYLLSRLKTTTRGALLVMSGFSLVLLAILLIAVVKDELLAAWQTQLPADIPNYFLINIATGDVAKIKRFLKDKNINSSSAFPLVRTRLTHINGKSIKSIDFSDERASRLLNHTFNVSYAEKLPDDNTIVAGKWISANSESRQFSIEKGMAESLQLKLGDRLSLRVAEQKIEAPITSIRSVLWENFKPNFYLIANRRLVDELPQTWLLSALVPSELDHELKRLLELFPSVTLLDITEVMARIRSIVERASIALEFFFIFALVSAFIVLLAAIQTGKHERQMESSLLRALSAHTSQLYQVHVLEFTLMGVLIGLFAALCASLAGWIISVYFFDIDYRFSAAIWGYSLLSSSLILTLAGTLVSRKVYNTSPMKILRS